jgi:flavin-binding protein dodecin
MLLESLSLFLFHSVHFTARLKSFPQHETTTRLYSNAALLLPRYQLLTHALIHDNKEQLLLFQGGFMNEHIYKQIELTGSSKTSMEDAVQNAISKASKTLHNLHWFQIVESRGYIENNKIDYWQVTIKLGFRLDD